jgi:hypothetical protein
MKTKAETARENKIRNILRREAEASAAARQAMEKVAKSLQIRLGKGFS